MIDEKFVRVERFSFRKFQYAATPGQKARDMRKFDKKYYLWQYCGITCNE